MIAETTLEMPVEPAAQRAYRVLERMIVTLELAPASTTTEGALIDRLALGRTPIREAIQRLAWDGLIEIRPRAGLVIAPLNATDWPLVIDARAGVEIVLASSAARHVSESAAVRLYHASRTMSQAVSEQDVSAFLVADKFVDEVIAGAAANDFAARVAMPLQTHSRRFWFRYQSDLGLTQSAEHHMRLIKAILERDEWQAGREAERLMGMLRRLAKTAAIG